MIARLALATALALGAAPAFAQQDPLAPIDLAPVTVAPAEPIIVLPPPPPPRVIPRDWRGVFDAIRAADWYGAAAGIEALPDSVLKPVARAELYTAANSPRTELAPLLALIAEAPDLPQAEQLQRLAMARGAIEPPPIVSVRPTIGLGSAPRRGRARPVAGLSLIHI